MLQDVIEVLQISDDADAARTAISMECSVNASSCFYRFTALTVKETFKFFSLIRLKELPTPFQKCCDGVKSVNIGSQIDFLGVSNRGNLLGEGGTQPVEKETSLPAEIELSLGSTSVPVLIDTNSTETEGVLTPSLATATTLTTTSTFSVPTRAPRILRGGGRPPLPPCPSVRHINPLSTTSLLELSAPSSGFESLTDLARSSRSVSVLLTPDTTSLSCSVLPPPLALPSPLPPSPTFLSTEILYEEFIINFESEHSNPDDSLNSTLKTTEFIEIAEVYIDGKSTVSVPRVDQYKNEINMSGKVIANELQIVENEEKNEKSIKNGNESKNENKSELNINDKKWNKKEEKVEVIPDIIKIIVKGTFTSFGRFKTKLEGALLSNLNDSRKCKKLSAVMTNCNTGVHIHASGVRNNNNNDNDNQEDMTLTSSNMLTPYSMLRNQNKWNRQADYALLDYLNTVAPTLASTATLLSLPQRIALSKEILAFSASSLSHFNLLDIQIRILMFEALNNNLEEIIPLLNVLCTDTHSIGAALRRNNRYIFPHIKQMILDKTIAATVAPSGSDLPAQLSLDNLKSLNSREKNPEPGDINCFVQAYRQLENKDSHVYRHVFSSDRVFQITFLGESGIDAGGVFREGTSRIIEDLFSEHFNLLLLCPNGRHEVHSNMDKYVPNPVLTDEISLKMFEFIGKLMGMSLRVQSCLPFEFAPIIWKSIMGEEIELNDLLSSDAISCRLLDDLRFCTDRGIVNEKMFYEKYEKKLKFIYVGSDGIEREIERGSRNRYVRFSNRFEYCNAVEYARKHEFDLQIKAIEKGLSEVIPMRALKLFSWQEVEILVSGSPMFDFELWKSKTEASGLSQKTVDLFWNVMSSLTRKEQSGFIRFAWGRSRLPPIRDFTTKMKLTFGQGKLPVAHTCFFSIELPEYSTEEEMRTGLLTAINYGVGGILLG